MPTPIRVLVADDHPIVRGGLVALLSTLADVEVVGEASDSAGQFARHCCRVPTWWCSTCGCRTWTAWRPRRIGRDLPGTAVLVLTMFDEDDLVADAIAAGARGYLLKGPSPKKIERALRTVAGGSAVLAPRISRRKHVRWRRVTRRPAASRCLS